MPSEASRRTSQLRRRDRGLHFNPPAADSEDKSVKTDPVRQGVDLFIGKTGNKLCPVTAMLSYMANRGSGEGMLFYYEDRKLLTRDLFSKCL